MKIQVIKESVSKFLEKDYDVLDLFYKMPGDYEFTKKEWGRLSFSSRLFD